MPWLSELKESLRRRRLSRRTPAEVFRRYYDKNKWGDAGSRSGKGSSLAATEELRRLLPPLLTELGVTELLDVPCGDFHWMAQTDLSGLRYTGGDIVPEMIARNREEHGRDGVRFQVIDLIKGPLPRADLVFCRDCLVHLSNAHIAAALENVRRSGATWLLTTTFPDAPENRDIATGQWRKVDLTKPPFRLRPPERLIEEGREGVKGQMAGKMLGLWRVADLPETAAG
ncbi:MAG: methyltransferase domain-containing protein [Paracoccaceae bacterium]|nr:methyltransferase domain-containing protein [Paracoccaceae bacterium]